MHAIQEETQSLPSADRPPAPGGDPVARLGRHRPDDGRGGRDVMRSFKKALIERPLKAEISRH